MVIILMGVLVAGTLLGVLIISLSFLAQEGEEDKVGTEILFSAAADSYYASAASGIGKVNQAGQYLSRS